jgi:hypothetical protein
LIPGTSRSGITITAGLAVGLTRQAAARFSFLLSIPIITLAGGLLVLDLMQQPAQAHWDVLVLGAVISAISAYLCIHFFLKLLERIGMLPFVLYRLGLGIGLFISSFNRLLSRGGTSFSNERGGPLLQHSRYRLLMIPGFMGQGLDGRGHFQNAFQALMLAFSDQFFWPSAARGAG